MAGMLNSTKRRGLADDCLVCPMPPPPPAETQSFCLGHREVGIYFWTLEERKGEGSEWKWVHPHDRQCLLSASPRLLPESGGEQADPVPARREPRVQ